MEISERFGFNLPSRDGDDLADINQISDNFRIIENVVPYVDESYNPKSKNPQSGEAVFGAIKTVRNPILDYIVYEIAEDGTVDIVSCDRAIKGDYIIPNTIEGYPVTSIGKSFSPASRWAFEGCENLTSIVIPDSVTLIGISAFSSCYNLKKIVMGSGVSTIGESAFYNCLALKEITIPENITKIDTGAFEKVNNLADVYYNGTSEQWNEIIVRGKNEPLVNATIHFNYDPTLTTKGYVDEALRNVVDQAYSPESQNAQSGVAVAEAIASANNNTKEEVLRYINTVSYPSQSSFAYTESDVYTGYWCYVDGTIEGGTLSVEWDETKLTKIQTIVYLFRNGNPYKYIQSSAGGTSLEGDNATANWIDAGTGSGFPFAYPFKLQIPEGCIPMVCMRSTNAVLPQGSPYASVADMGADAKNLISVSVSKEIDNDITKKLDIEQGEGKANRILTTDSTGKIVAVNIDPKSTEMRPSWDTVIHRGWVNGAKENTIPAFYLAKENGYDWVECDVRITADEQLVIWHDATVSGTNLSGQNTTLTIATSTLNDLQSLVLETHKRFGEIKINTLDELLIMARCLGMKVLIEAKVSTKSVLEKVAKTVLRYGMSKNVVYLLGGATVCQYVAAIDKNASFDVLKNPTIGENYTEYASLLTGANTVTFDVNAITWDFNETTIQEINAAGIGLSFWNVLQSNIDKCIDAGALRVTKHNQDDATDLNAIYFRNKTFWQ